MRLSKILPACLIAGFAAFPVRVLGQTVDNYGIPWSGPLAAANSNRIINHMASDRRLRLKLEDWARKHEKESLRRPTIKTTFPAHTRRVISQRFDPDKRAELAGLMAKCDRLYAMTMSQATDGNPFALNDLASSMVFLVALNHYMYWDGQPEAPLTAQTTHMKELRERIGASLMRSPNLAAMDDVQKRAVHDGFVVGTCLPFIQYTQAKKVRDERGKLAIRRHASATLQKVGLTPTFLRFKADGTVQFGSQEGRPAGP